MISTLDAHLPEAVSVRERDDTFLRRNNALYEALLRQMTTAQRSAETTLWCLQKLAEFCQFHHTGRFADGRLENIGLKIGLDLDQMLLPWRASLACFKAPRLSQLGRRHNLHVATSVQAVGGHTRTIKNWILNDPDSCHSVLLTWQGGVAVPPWLGDTVRGQGGELIVLPEGPPLLARAQWLRETARSGADVVVLHHYGYDIVPIVAFAVRDCPPVALVNHADHLFWMGSTVADAVINQRPVGKELSPRRLSRFDVTLPIPLVVDGQAPSRTVIRERLGIPMDQTVLLSVGRASKYIPTRKHHFVRTAAAILEESAEAHLYLLGVGEGDRRVLAGADGHPRLHFLGPIEDASLYQRAADIYLEGFPFGSQTALLEAALAGLPVIPVFAPPFKLLATSDEALEGLVSTPGDEAEYVTRAGMLIRDCDERKRLGRRLQERVLDLHVGTGWQRCLASTFDEVCRLGHDPRPIPETPSLAADTDLALSTWQAFNAGNDSQSDLASAARNIWLASAYGAREVGDYRGALALLCSCLRQQGWNAEVLQAVAKLLPYWAWQRLCPRRVPAVLNSCTDMGK